MKTIHQLIEDYNDNLRNTYSFLVVGLLLSAFAYFISGTIFCYQFGSIGIVFIIIAMSGFLSSYRMNKQIVSILKNK